MHDLGKLVIEAEMRKELDFNPKWISDQEMIIFKC